jgi:hypothetical protein
LVLEPSIMKYLFLALISFPLWALDSRYEGTADFSNCSGFVFKTAGTPLTNKAWVMTNGHCVTNLLGRMVLTPGQAIVNQTKSRSVSLVTERLTKLKLNTRKLVYATMTGTDMAVYELHLSYQDLLDRGIRSFELSTTSPKKADLVEVISGHKNVDFDCAIDEVLVGLREGGFDFIQSLRFSGTCEQSNGTSGSPVLLKDTRQVVGISNTFNKSGRSCTDNNPCEVDSDGSVSIFHGARYGQQTVLLNECIKDGKVDLNLVSCKLTRP